MILPFYSFGNGQILPENLKERTDFMASSVKTTVRKSEKTSAVSSDLIFICLSLSVPAVYYGGLTALIQLFTSVITCFLSEWIFMKLILKRNFASELSFLSSALIIALLLPSCVPLYVTIITCIFAVAVCVFPFGGWSNTPFLPSAAAIAFASVAFKEEMSLFPLSSSDSEIIFSSSPLFISGETLFSQIKNGGTFSLDFFTVTDILSGALPGAMGCTCILALVACFLYLFIRNRKSLIPSFGYLLSCTLFALIFPALSGGRLLSAFLELSSGSLLFTAVLLINHKSTTPTGSLRAFVYGLLGGLITMLLRRFSPTASPEVFSVLFMNALWLAFSANASGNEKTSFPVARKEADSK